MSFDFEKLLKGDTRTTLPVLKERIAALVRALGVETIADVFASVANDVAEPMVKASGPRTVAAQIKVEAQTALGRAVRDRDWQAIGWLMVAVRVVLAGQDLDDRHEPEGFSGKVTEGER